MQITEYWKAVCYCGSEIFWGVLGYRFCQNIGWGCKQSSQTWIFWVVWWLIYYVMLCHILVCFSAIFCHIGISRSLGQWFDDNMRAGSSQTVHKHDTTGDKSRWLFLKQSEWAGASLKCKVRVVPVFFCVATTSTTNSWLKRWVLSEIVVVLYQPVLLTPTYDWSFSSGHSLEWWRNRGHRSCLVAFKS